MINLSHSIPRSPNKQTFRDEEIEPHVELFQFGDDHFQNGVFSLKYMHFFVGFFLICTIISWAIFGSHLLIRWCMSLQLCILPIYLIFIAVYLQYILREKKTTLEIDWKNELLQFRSKKYNVLFHKNQVLECEIVANLLLPHQLDYVKITLEGGNCIYVSSLIIDSRELIRYFNIPFLLKELWIGYPPRHYHRVSSH